MRVDRSKGAENEKKVIARCARGIDGSKKQSLDRRWWKELRETREIEAKVEKCIGENCRI